MGQILAVDFGKKRCGLAATDDLRIIASGLDTVETTALMVVKMSISQTQNLSQKMLFGTAKT